MAEPKDMMAAVTTSMKERTGRTLAEWVDLVKASDLDPLDQKAVRNWLRDAHGVPQNSQWAIAFATAESCGWTMPSTDEFADNLYAGKKSALRPLHDAVIAAALSCGPDTEAQGRSTYIPVVRKTQFVAVAPGPRGTLRVGFRYRTVVPDDARLSPAKGFAQATHWLHLDPDADPLSIGAELESLLAQAYNDNG